MKIHQSVVKRLPPQPVLDPIIIVFAGLSILTLAYVTSFPRLINADEIVYMTGARNIASFKGPYTNFYIPASIAEKGYPLGDVHMPGYMFLLSAFVLLLGPHEFVAFLPSQLAFVAGGIVIFWIAKTIFNRQVGFWTALWFFLLPDVFIWANTGLMESSLTLLSTVFLWVWYQAVTKPRLTYSFWLAFLIVLGMFFREAFLIFLLPTFYALWRWPSLTRFKAWFIFLVLFLIGVLLLMSFNQLRAPYPWTTAISHWETLAELEANIEKAVGKNLKEISKISTTPIYMAQIPKYVITLLAMGSLWVFRPKLWKLSLYHLVTFIPTLMFMFFVYQIYRWVGLRIFAMLMPAGIIVTCAALFCLPGRWRYVTLSGGTLILLTLSLLMNNMHAQDRKKDFEEQSLQAQTIVELTFNRDVKPKVVMGEQPFLFGWQEYPVIVIWHKTSDLNTWRALRRWISVDVIVVDKPSERDKLLKAMDEGLIEDNFVLLNQEPINGYYLFALE